jgi:alkyl hydroperoxide reductase subunit AhpC
MLTIGDRLPAFDLNAVISIDPDKAFQRIDQASNPGKWKVLFFWPKDFTFVCPTEIAAFGKLNTEFNDRDAVIYGVSIDSEFVHLAQQPCRPEEPAVPDAGRHQARTIVFAGRTGQE